MPYTICPVCGGFGHLNIGDPTRWFAERGRHPIYPARCLFCWPELAIGDRVEVRVAVASPIPVQAGECGGVAEIVSHPEDGTLYRVRLDDGRDAWLWRAVVRKRKAEGS